MKDFLKNVLATFVGLLVFCLVAFLLCMMSFVGMVASSSSTQTIAKKSVLVLNLSGDLEEQTTDDLFTQLNGTTFPGLSEMLNAVKKAKDNDRVEGIYIEAGALSADMAQLQELREALESFKKSGKWIIAYGENFTQGCYYLASVADKVYMNPEGIFDWAGIGVQTVYVKDLLGKVGVKVVPIKVGKYKSATEMFTEDKMSDANRAQTERFIGGWWNELCQQVSKSRKIPVDQLNAYADRLAGIYDQKSMVKAHFFDGLIYGDEVKALVKKKLNLDEDDAISQVSVDQMNSTPSEEKGDKIVVYYLYGDIINEELPQQSFQDGHYIVAKDVCKNLEDLADDDDVKAVVLRVNSPGGSAYASEQIWHQIQNLKKKKPVVVSMGGYAASGGYYISCGANYIFAEPTTLTGSIGIFGLIPDASELYSNKLGIKMDEAKTNRNSVVGIPRKPLTAEQYNYIRMAIDKGYNTFKSRVSQGRKLTMAQVEELAQGHVYLGEDALKLHLVDGLGGLDKAVGMAAKLADLKEHHVEEMPEPEDMLSQFLNSGLTDNGNFLDDQMRVFLGSLYEPVMMVHKVQTMDRIQARMPFMLTYN